MKLQVLYVGMSYIDKADLKTYTAYTMYMQCPFGSSGTIQWQKRRQHLEIASGDRALQVLLEHQQENQHEIVYSVARGWELAGIKGHGQH